MTDLRELLDTAAGEPAAPTPDVVSSDLRRGRIALRRRRGVRGASALVAASAAVALGLAVVPASGTARPGRRSSPGGTSPTQASTCPLGSRGGSEADQCRAGAGRLDGLRQRVRARDFPTRCDDLARRLPGSSSPCSPATRPPPATRVPSRSARPRHHFPRGRHHDPALVAAGRPRDGRPGTRSLHLGHRDLVRFAESLTVSADAKTSRLTVAADHVWQ